MPETTCTMCSGYGQIIRIFDGKKIRCPDCTGYGHVNKPPRQLPPAHPRKHRPEHQRPPAEIRERQTQSAGVQPDPDNWGYYQPSPRPFPTTPGRKTPHTRPPWLHRKIKRHTVLITWTIVIAAIIAFRLIPTFI